MGTALEHILIKEQKTGMIAWLKANPEYFGEAVRLALSDRHPYNWRAASLLWGAMKRNDPRIDAHIDDIVAAIPSKKDGHQRELLKILMAVQLDDETEGYVFDLCMTIWEQPNKQASVRHMAFMTIMKTAKKHPELAKEILFLTQGHYLETLSPGVKHSVIRAAGELRQAVGDEEA